MRRWLNRTGFLLVLIISVVSTVLAEGDLSFRAGLGYEFISQEYFLDSLALSGADTLATITSLKTTYLDDVTGRLSATYRPSAGSTLEFEGTLEQTPDVFRARFNSEYRPVWGKVKVDWTGELDWREGVSDAVAAGESYLLGYGKARFMLPITEISSLWWQAHTEFIQFDSAGDYSYDHNRLGGKLGLSWSMTDFSSLVLNSFLMTRNVPDSSELDYANYGAEVSYFGFMDGGTLDLYGRLEKRDYRLPGDQDDYFGLELNGRHKVNVGDRLFLQQDLDVEAFSFDQDDFINRNYIRAKLVLQAGLQGTELSAAIGPHMELLSEAQDEFITGEDYFEAGIRGNLDFFKPSLFGLLESTLGHRNIYGEAELQSDFVFHRLNCVFDWRFWGAVSFNSMLSAEWEWHENAEENSQLFLVSSWLTCRF